MVITVDQFKKIFPQNKNPQPVVDALNLLLPKYGIDIAEEICAYLAECGTESQGFTVFVENLNYSADTLLKVFPSHFDATTVGQYERQPQKIANRVYANRMGNGDESSNDGWTFKGRGAVQITGRSNYTLFAQSIGKSLDDTVAYCETVEGAICSSLWFWQTNGLEKYDDLKEDFITLTKKINGGLNGLVQRQYLYNVALTVII